MTDKELIALFESKLPQELTLEEIHALRARLRESPAVRQAFSGRLQLEQYLSATVARVELSADSIFAAAGRANRFGRGGLWSWLGWTVCLLMVGFVVSVSAWALTHRPAAEKLLPTAVAEADKNPPKPNAAKEPDGAADKSHLAAGTGEVAAHEHPGDATTGHAPAENAGERALEQAAQKAEAEKAAKKAAGRIEIDATKWSRGNAIEVDLKKFGIGIGIIRSVAEHSFVEYDFQAAAAGEYQLEIRYAAVPARPTRLSINGQQVKDRATSEPTGSLFPQGQRWFVEGVFPLKQERTRCDWTRSSACHI